MAPPTPGSSGEASNIEFVSSLLSYDPSDPTATEQLPFELRPLKDESIRALRRLAEYKPPRDPYPMERRAAVMVALFPSRKGDLNVLLTTRSADMRTYAGETALPGGKLDPSDLDLEFTARREAFEECGMPIDRHKVKKLTTLQPFLSRSQLIVTPVVCYIIDAQTITPVVNPSEVSKLFSHPLSAFLSSHAPPALLPQLRNAATLESAPDRYVRRWEMPWFSEEPYRLFRFESKASPIVGFTADVLLETAVIAYGRQPEFERYAKGQHSMRRIIELCLDEIAEDERKLRAKM